VPADAGGVAQGVKNPLHYGISDRLKRERTAQGIAVSVVAMRAGLSRSTALKIEDGAVPRIDVVERLARVLGVKPGWLAYARPREEAERGTSDLAEQHAGAGERLRQARELAKLTRAELGRRTATKYPTSGDRQGKKLTGLSGTAILNIEDGRGAASVANIERLADALGLSPAWLAFGEGKGPTKPREPAE
jgi:transcriptional regulator with XRE-family HTH domain